MNRYGYINKLLHCYNNVYKLFVDKELNYIRSSVGGSSESLDFVDLEGGPFISPGFAIENIKISNIKNVSGEFYFDVEFINF